MYVLHILSFETKLCACVETVNGETSKVRAVIGVDVTMCHAEALSIERERNLSVVQV
jgi:hypothetical protein